MSPLEEVGHPEVIWLLGSLSGLYHLPFDAVLVAQEFPPPVAELTLPEPANRHGARSACCSSGAATPPAVDEVFSFGADQRTTRMEVVEEDRK